MPDTLEKPPTAAGYDEDFFLWTQAQAEALREAGRAGVNASVDWENVAEEIESLGRRDRREARSLIFDILLFFIKLQASSQIDRRDDWKNRVRDLRWRLEQIFEDSPSLKAQLFQLVEEEWQAAVSEAALQFREDGEDEQALKSLVYLKLVGPAGEYVIADERFPGKLA